MPANGDDETENKQREEFLQLVLSTLSPCGIVQNHRTDLSALTKLNLPGCGLSSLPSSLPELCPNLSILFMPKNHMKELPAVIGKCPKLQMVSFKDNGMTSIAPEALQPQMRWLILTGNQITALPDTIGRCTKLQKLMLSGNRIKALPETISGCTNLELIRLACNQLAEPPMQLLQLPQLRWVAFSSNPFLVGLVEAHDTSLSTLADDTLDKDDWPVLGQGAGGITRKAEWKKNDAATTTTTTVAVKTFVGELTSDGSPQDERAISVVASSTSSSVPPTKKSKLDDNHNNNNNNNCLISLLGQTPKGALVMEYLDAYDGLAGPPSMETCSRDVYSRTNMSLTKVETTVMGLLHVLTNLHAKGICHGDFYGHNILIHEGITEEDFRVKLSDFGAAFFYDRTAPYAKLIEKIEMRAFGVLVEELQALLGDSGEENPLFAKLVGACYGSDATSFADLDKLTV